MIGKLLLLVASIALNTRAADFTATCSPDQVTILCGGSSNEEVTAGLTGEAPYPLIIPMTPVVEFSSGVLSGSYTAPLSTTAAGVVNISNSYYSAITLNGITHIYSLGVSASTNTALSLPDLERVYGDTFSIGTIKSFSAPKLKSLNMAFNFNFTTATIISLPALYAVNGNIVIGSNSALTEISMPSLSLVGVASGLLSNITLNNNGAALSTITLTGLTRANFIQAQTGNSKIRYLRIGSVGVTKELGSILNFSAQNLDQASVDYVLAVIASLDGTGGTTSWGAGKTLSLNGGTSSAPSAAGLVNKAIIQARGAVVNTN